MDKYSYTSLPSSTNSVGTTQKVWKAVALIVSVLAITFWSGTFLHRRSQGSLKFQQGIEIKDEGELLGVLVDAPAGKYNGSYYYYDSDLVQFSGMSTGVRSWKGIRFGKNPERFTSPVLADPLPPQEIYQNYDSPGCVQPNDHDIYFGINPGNWISEDCLFLSITAPLTSCGGNGCPVVVYYHAGAFVEGLGADYPGADSSTFSKNGIVGVVPNYRLGIFGAMATTNVSGTYGFQDQQLALVWVQKNIAAFGGDPSKVTIMGGSSGAQSVAAHLASPGSAGLYAAGAMGSGPIGLLYPTIERARSVSAAVFQSAGCDVDDVACMRNLTYQEILAVQMDVPTILQDSQCIYMMFVDPQGDIPVQPFSVIKNGAYPDVPLLVSFVPDEGISFVMEYINSPITIDDYPKYLESFAGLFMHVDNTTAATIALQKLYPFTKETTDGRFLLSEIVTDALVVCPTFSMSEGAIAQGRKIYLEMFDHVFSYELSPSLPAWDHTSVTHGADFPCVWDAVNAEQSGKWAGDEAEVLMCHYLNTAYSNFMQSGNPNEGRPLEKSMTYVPLTPSAEILIVSTESAVGKYSRYSLCTEYWNAVQPIPE